MCGGGVCGKGKFSGIFHNVIIQQIVLRHLFFLGTQGN